MTQSIASAGETRTVSVADIHVQEQFNPRGEFELAALERLTASTEQHGVLQHRNP